MNKKILLLIMDQLIGPFRAIVLPCLFPCGAPLGRTLFPVGDRANPPPCAGPSDLP